MKNSTPEKTQIISESFLRSLWNERFFSKLQLHTTSSLTIEILEYGILNNDSGPDFLNAKIKIGKVIYRGDVEFHTSTSAWNTHNHNRDKRYNSTILHVVLFHNAFSSPIKTKSDRELPILELGQYFPNILQQFEENQSDKNLKHIYCFERNSFIESNLIKTFLEKLAFERMEFKIRKFQQRLTSLVEEKRKYVSEPLTQYGVIIEEGFPEEIPVTPFILTKKDFRNKLLWEQLLYEGVFEALGYSKNQESFFRLAKILSLEVIKNYILVFENIAVEYLLENIFFACSRLLPASAKNDEEKTYCFDCRKHWEMFLNNPEGRTLLYSQFDESDWQFFRLRPDNFPTIRIAGGARIVKRFIETDILKFIIALLKQPTKSIPQKIVALETLFSVHADGFWKTHYTFGSVAKKEITMFVGNERAREIIINVIIPIGFLYARVFNDSQLRKELQKLYFSFPSLQANTISKTIHQELVKKNFHSTLQPFTKVQFNYINSIVRNIIVMNVR